jgi:hypothetical protein
MKCCTTAPSLLRKRYPEVVKLAFAMYAIGVAMAQSQPDSLRTYQDPQGRFQFTYPAAFGMPARGTDNGFRNRTAAVRFSGASLPMMAGWRVYTDKKVNQITGVRNTQAIVGAKGLSTADLFIGCVDNRPILRFGDRFKTLAIQGLPGSYFSIIKVRASSNPAFIEQQVTAVIFNDTIFLLMDDRAAEMIPQMKTSASLFAQLTYRDEVKVTEFSMSGLDAALAKMAAAGCRL